MATGKLAPHHAKDFILGGQAVFTVSNGKGENFTYKVVSHIFKDTDIRRFFIHALTDPSKEKDFSYMGMVLPENLKIVLTRKSKFKKEETVVKVAKWALWHAATQRPFPPGYSISHDGRCAHCGRTLEADQSVRTGFGEECYSRKGLYQRPHPIA